LHLHTKKLHAWFGQIFLLPKGHVMNYLALLLLLPTLSIASDKAATAPNTTTVRQGIGRAKVVAFSKDYLIKSGLDDKEIAKWDATIKTSLGYSTPSKNELLLSNADQLFYTLDNANAFVKTTVKKLNNLYSTLYVKKDGNYIPDFKTIPLQPASLNELTALHKQAQDLRAKVIDVAQQAFPRSYVDAQPAPDSWVKMYLQNDAGKLQTARELFPVYLELIRDYDSVKNVYTDFKNIYSSRYNLIKQKPSETDKELKKREDSFAALLEKIERCEYRVSKDKEKAALRKFANEIRTEFPTILSTLDMYKIPKSTSMQRTVLSAYSEGMEGVLNQIIRETNTLIDAAQSVNK